MDKQNNIYTSKEVVWHCKEEHGLDIKTREAIKILKDDFGLQYRHMTKAAPHINSVRNRVLRQQQVMEYIKVLNTGKTCICIDETDLEYTNGRFMRWCRRDLPNSKPSMHVYPRISIILALSTRGEMYI